MYIPKKPATGAYDFEKKDSDFDYKNLMAFVSNAEGNTKPAEAAATNKRDKAGRARSLSAKRTRILVESSQSRVEEGETTVDPDYLKKVSAGVKDVSSCYLSLLILITLLNRGSQI